MRNAFAVFATGLCIATFCAAASAERLPKYGSISFHTAWKFAGEALTVADKHVQGHGSVVGATFNDKGTGPLQFGAAECSITFFVIEGHGKIRATAPSVMRTANEYSRISPALSRPVTRVTKASTKSLEAPASTPESREAGRGSARMLARTARSSAHSGLTTDCRKRYRQQSPNSRYARDEATASLHAAIARTPPDAYQSHTGHKPPLASWFQVSVRQYS